MAMFTREEKQMLRGQGLMSLHSEGPPADTNNSFTGITGFQLSGGLQQHRFVKL
jgi:hypothetical protein